VQALDLGTGFGDFVRLAMWPKGVCGVDSKDRRRIKRICDTTKRYMRSKFRSAPLAEIASKKEKNNYGTMVENIRVVD
jgi:hypothetical protein